MYIGVAVIDTGIYRHRDFDNRIVAFADFVNNKKLPYDDSGHGTHVSGIIAGSGAASGGRYRGIAKNAGIIAVKVLDKAGNGKVENVISGLSWISENKKKYNIRVVNISFGTTQSMDLDEDSRLVKAVESLWDEGIVVVAAAGNSGPDVNSVTAPGISRKIITVGAYDDYSYMVSHDKKRKNQNGYRKNQGIKYYSGRGPTACCIVKPELVVAGSDMIACANRKNSYSIKSGTSMAAPIVSGAIARYMQENNENISPKYVKKRLKSFCKKIDVPYNQQGWGVLDVYGFIKNNN